jgi:hypothetical protein
MYTNIAAERWEVVLPDPRFDAVLECWTAEAEFAEVQRAIDGMVMCGLDLDHPVDLDRVIEHVTASSDHAPRTAPGGARGAGRPT